MAIALSDQGTAIVAAASKYKVPVTILAGVEGNESDFGSDSATSSAGATGYFQFIPSTASSYGYPQTNAPTLAQYQAQADAAAHYLSDLYNQTKSWSVAIQRYSAGGYTLDSVLSKAQTNHPLLQAIATAAVSLPTGTSVPPGLTGPGGVAGALDSAATTTGSTVSAAANEASSVASLVGDLTNPATWVRILKVVAGAVLIVMGLRELANAGGAHIPGPGKLASASAVLA